MTCTVLLEVTAQEGKGDALVDMFRSILGDTRAFDGCEGIEVIQDLDTPTSVVLIERWASREHYETYFNWRQESGTLAAMGEFLAAPPTKRYFATQDA